MARDFLAGLDPEANRFTFQFFSDSGRGSPKILHGTLDDVWPTVLKLNTPQQGAGVFVTIAETDLKGRRNENIVRSRGLFADADNKEQVERCTQALKACGVTPSMIVKSGRGYHFYFCADDIPRDQFSALQKSLIEKLGTDAAVHDLPRVMRLPGTLHLKNPAQPRLVKLYPTEPVRRWKLPELIAKLGLSPAMAASNQAQACQCQHSEERFCVSGNATARLGTDHQELPILLRRAQKWRGRSLAGSVEPDGSCLHVPAGWREAGTQVWQ